MSFPNLTFWSGLLETVGLEVCVLVALGFVAQFTFRRAYWQRAMWQMTMICVLLVSASEWTGFGRGTVWYLLGPKREIKHPGPRNMWFNSPSVLVPSMPPRNYPSPALKAPVWWPGTIWIAGTALVFGRIAIAQVLLLALRLRREKITDSLLQERVQRVAKAVGLRRKICLLRLPESISPMAFGLLRPCVGLPPNFEKEFSDAEQDAILAHEFGHLSARDPVWFLLADLVSALLWWHPFVWLARRSLHISSEMAADEATALVPDGPDSLAKCLVALGKRMTSRRGWGWVGISGGFRSKLGKRVERLVAMSGIPFRPSGGWADATARIALTIVVIPAAVLIAAAVQTAFGESETNLRASWETSPGALLLVAAREAAEKPDKEITARIEDAKLLYEMGKLDEAKIILIKVLKQDPSNKTAAYYLNLIKEVQFMDRHRPAGNLKPIPLATNEAVQSVPIPLNTNGSFAFVTTGRQNILSKLDEIHFDKAQYDLPLTEVLKRLTIEAQKRDTAGMGLYFLLNPHIASTAIDIRDVTIKISPPLSNVRLVDVLNAIVKSADKPIKYTVEDYAVVFSPKPSESQALHSEVFHVDPIVFTQNLKHVFETNQHPGLARLHFGPRPLSAENNRLEMDDGPRRADDGHDSFGGPVAPSMKIASPTRTNQSVQLDQMVRAYLTTAGIDFEDPGKSVFFNERLGLLLVRATQDDLKLIEQAVDPLNQSPPQVTISAKFFDLSKKDFAALGFNWFLQADKGTMTGVMSDSQFRAAINAIEHRTGVDVLSAPKVTTLSGRQAHVSSMTGTNGTALDIVATVKPDGYTIGMFAWARVQMDPMSWSATDSRDLQDGQTLVLGKVLTNQPEAGNLGLAFVTVTIIDPAGNRVHTDDELSGKH